MAANENHSPSPLVPTNTRTPRTRRDEQEVAREDSRELRRKKRIKYLLYFVAFVIFQTGIIVLFTQTLMKIRTPKFRVRSATFDNFTVGTQSNPSFDLRMNAQLGIKNTNFGNFRYRSTTVYFYYRGTTVGEAFIPNSNVGWKTTRKIDVVINLSSSNLTFDSQVTGTDLSRGVLPITSQSDLRGKVRLTFIFTKKKSAKMNCTMDVVTATQQLTNISCK